mmetsp:Transcript_38240/g.109933  ORF Transcript_38240/g.109933 Transcript_38240/m.109933 type:complete len:200 (-) Transcript_38240:767-1366(-)
MDVERLQLRLGQELDRLVLEPCHNVPHAAEVVHRQGATWPHERHRDDEPRVGLVRPIDDHHRGIVLARTFAHRAMRTATYRVETVIAKPSSVALAAAQVADVAELPRDAAQDIGDEKLPNALGIAISPVCIVQRIARRFGEVATTAVVARVASPLHHETVAVARDGRRWMSTGSMEEQSLVDVVSTSFPTHVRALQLVA